MNRRSASPKARILISVATVMAAMTLSSSPSALASTDEPVPVATDDITIDTVNPFLPDDVDLTSCVGTLQRPGCGSEARGGWHQNLVAIAMIAGLLIVFGRVVWGVRRGQRNADVASERDA